MKSNRFWLILLGGVVMISIIAAIIIGQGSGSFVHVYHDGKLTDTVNIIAVTEPFTITVESGSGNNVIEIERSRVRMLSADCPDGTCVRQGWISGGVFPIVCLPNKVVVTFTGGDIGRAVDAVVG